MVRSLLAATLALALALPAATTPVRADAEDAARVVGGLVALYVLKEALERRQDRKEVRRVAPSTRHHNTVRRHSHIQPRHRQGGARHRDRVRDVRIIPSTCRRNVTLNNGRAVTAYGARCMQNRVARPGILPPNCIRRVSTHRGQRNVYGPRCLARNGWSERHARR
ncbi:MAG: hypothetical protein AAFY65_01585 [Pseudomonadota bacterium]